MHSASITTERRCARARAGGRISICKILQSAIGTSPIRRGVARDSSKGAAHGPGRRLFADISCGRARSGPRDFVVGRSGRKPSRVGCFGTVLYGCQDVCRRAAVEAWLMLRVKAWRNTGSGCAGCGAADSQQCVWRKRITAEGAESANCWDDRPGVWRAGCGGDSDVPLAWPVEVHRLAGRRVSANPTRRFTRPFRYQPAAMRRRRNARRLEDARDRRGHAP